VRWQEKARKALHNPIQRQQAAARGAVVAGAEGERGFDLDADPVRRDRGAVMRAVHREAAGRDRPELTQARRNPVPRRDRLEYDLGLDGCRTHQPPHRGLVGRLLEMDLDRPAPVRALKRRDGCFRGLEVLGKQVGEAFGGLLVANQPGNGGISTDIHGLGHIADRSCR
jgi:hypothetical protein